MSIGEKWEVFWERTGAWRPAELINELGSQVELMCTDAPHEPDLQKTISTTREAMKNRSRFRPSKT
jgi:hypothetical protein